MEQHSGELAAQWRRHPQTPAGSCLLDGHNAVFGASASGGLFTASGRPMIRNVRVLGQLTVSAAPGSGEQAGLAACVHSTRLTGYIAYADAATSSWNIIRFVNGAPTLLTSAGVTFAVGHAYSLVLTTDFIGVSLQVDGQTACSTTDTTIQPGSMDDCLAGVYCQSSSNGTGSFRLSAFKAEDSVAEPIQTTPIDGSWFDNGYGGSVGGNYIRTSGQARYIVDTNAPVICLKAYCDAFASYGASYPGLCSLGVRVTMNGVTIEYNPTCNASGSNLFTMSLLPGPKRVEIVQGAQTTGGSPYLMGTWLVSATFYNGSYADPVAPSASNKLVVYGDSISAGGNSDYPATQSWLTVLRKSYDGSVQSEAWGCRALYDDMSSGGSGFISHLAGLAPSRLWIAIGTNDYGLNKWSAAQFGAAYASLLDGVHRALPGCFIVCQTPLSRASEAPNAFGCTTGDYRAAITAAAAARPWVSLADGTKILTTQELQDGLHPTTEGHLRYSAFVAAALKALPAAASVGINPGL